MMMCSCLCVMTAALGLAAGGDPAAPAAPAEAEAVLARADVAGGLCVHVGFGHPGAPPLAAALASSGRFLVHGLDRDAGAVAAARGRLRALGLYGRASVEHWQAETLPYADNLVNLLVVEGPWKVPQAEIDRVLAPGGVALTRQGDGWRKYVKPRPAGMDDWTHWRHGPDRNAVSKDTLVDVPGRVQWLFTREAAAERAHFVFADGRCFAQDGGTIVARDAFNGLPLWKAPIRRGDDFQWEWTVKVAALIVAKGRRVYCLAEDNRLKALDAATGKPVTVYEHAGVPMHILLVDDGQSKLGTLVLAGPDFVRALDAETGRLLWTQQAQRPHNVIACGYAVFYIEGNDRRGAAGGVVFGRELATGKLMWRKPYDWARRTELGAYGYDLLVYETRSPNNWRELYEAQPEQREKDRAYQMVVLSARSGEEVGRVARLGSSARHGEFRRAFWYKQHLLTEAVSREGLGIAMFRLYDFTKPAELFRANYAGDRGFGHCYPPVLTDRFYINGQLHFTDLATRKQVANPITRGSCNTSRAGYLPANGMIYTFPKHCICFPMLEGNVCLAPAYQAAPPETAELVRGPAWPAQPTDGPDDPGDWPTFRHDAHRTAGTDAAVPAKLRALWTARIDGPDYAAPRESEWRDNPFTAGSVSAPVVAGGLVYVAQGDTHRLIALDARSGDRRWEFTANGRIDGPPTIHRRMCLFGCRSGWVYNLRAADGEVIWRLRVAPYERRISAYGQLESPWPASASVLVTDGLAYVTAGLHPNADGGIRVVCFRPETGQLVWKGRFDDLGFADAWPDPYEPRKARPDSNPWRTIRPMEYRPHDLPVRDGNAVAISRCLFDLKTGRIDLRKTSGFYRVADRGIYMPRTAWRYGNARISSPPAAARGRSVFTSVPGISKLFRVDFEPDGPFNADWVKVSPEDEKAGFTHSTTRLYRMGTKWAVDSADDKRHVNRALLVAGDRLFVATRRGELLVHSTEDGRKLAEMELGLTAWDGLAAANGRLYLTTEGGKVICLGQ